MPDYIPPDDDIIPDAPPAVPIVESNIPKCEVPGCKNPMYLVFMGHYVCWGHWLEDWKSINLKKIFGIKEDSVLTIEYLRKKGLE